MELFPIKGYEEYYSITKNGKVFSNRTNKWIKLQVTKTGYNVFSTRFNGRKSKAVCLRVHVLVATTFLENPLKLPQVNHIDGNKLNNTVENLEWCTAKENTQHAIKIGLFKLRRGVNHPRAKLSEQDIIEIRNNLENKTTREMAKIYGVSHSTIVNCKNKINYK